VRALLTELGITPGGDFDLLIDRAWRVHLLQQRVPELVSRPWLLYAAATIQPLVLAVFETNGLRFRAWEQSLGLEERPRFDEPPEPVEFPVSSDSTVPALKAYTRAGQSVRSIRSD